MLKCRAMKNIKLPLIVAGAIVLLTASSLVYFYLFRGPSKSIAALRRVQAAAETGTTLIRFSDLVADAQVAVDEDCPDSTTGDTCSKIRYIQHAYKTTVEFSRDDGRLDFTMLELSNTGQRLKELK